MKDGFHAIDSDLHVIETEEVLRKISGRQVPRQDVHATWAGARRISRTGMCRARSSHRGRERRRWSAPTEP